MKDIGIVCDNHKVEKFKKELTLNGFTDHYVVPFTGPTSTIKVRIQGNQVNDIRKICEYVELYFKRSN